jgi:hypothetical protein
VGNLDSGLDSQLDSQAVRQLESGPIRQRETLGSEIVQSAAVRL